MGQSPSSAAGTDTLTIDDSADTLPDIDTISSTSVTGASPQPINYSNISTLTVLLGSGANNTTIASTASSTTTDLFGGAGNDTVTIQGDSGPTNIDTGGGSNTASMCRAPAPKNTNIAATGGTNAVTVSNNHNTDGVSGTVTITGTGTDSL